MATKNQASCNKKNLSNKTILRSQSIIMITDWKKCGKEKLEGEILKI